MATPPFDPNANSPSASDLISQFPNDEQTFRDIIESWLLTLSDRDGKIKLDALSNVTEALVPPGVTVPYAGTTPPAGWLFANGAEVSRSTYAALFAVAGTSFGAGNGTTTFNIPDLRARAVFGRDNMGAAGMTGRISTGGSGISGATQGAAGGAQNHTLLSAEMPSHAHGAGTLSAASAGAHSHTGTAASSGNHSHTGSAASAGAHSHSVSGTAASAGSHTHNLSNTSYRFALASGGNLYVRAFDVSGGGEVPSPLGVTTGGAHTHSVSGTAASAGAHTHTVSTNTTGAHTHSVTTVSAGAHTHNVTGTAATNGGSEAHNNMPPALIMSYIVKT